MRIQKALYRQILAQMPPAPPETGGILGRVGSTICAFAFDPGSPCPDRAVYTPRTETLNRIIREWAEAGVEFCGILHTHPQGQEELSSGDLSYIRRILDAMPPEIRWLWFPVILPEQKIAAFRAEGRGGSLRILPDPPEPV